MSIMQRWIGVLLFVVYMNSCHCIGCSGTTTYETNTIALHNLYTACKGEYWVWGSQPGNVWNFTGEPDPCLDEWQGVNCTNSASLPASECVVSSLMLSGYNLTCSLPSDIGSLSDMLTLALGNNSISGELPISIYNTTRLEYLKLDGNALTGRIPTDIYKLNELTHLSMFSNYFSHNIPNELLVMLPNLKHINVGDNLFTGSVPITPPNCGLTYYYVGYNKLNGNVSEVPFENFNNITYLAFDENNFVGSVSSSIGTLRFLTGLTFAGNVISGQLPSEMVQLQQLLLFSISGNRVDGTLPLFFGSMASLTHLDLGSNYFHNTTIPASYGLLTNLVELDLNGQAFLIGSIPATFTKLVKLELLYLSINLLTGSLPDFSLLESLNNLWLNDNLFSGPLPHSLFNLTRLGSLALGQNMFTSTIPAAIAAMTGLTHLNLGGNSFQGTIPDGLYNLTSLAQLYLYANLFNGTINPSVASLQSLEILSVNYNIFNGTIPDAMGQLPYLTVLDLELNLLTGSIPPCLGCLSGLTAMYLSYNSISGEIPSTVGSLVALKQLAMNTLSLTGSLPSTLCSLSNMEALDLSFNMLSGLLLSCFDSMSVLSTFYMDNNLLTGALPSLNELEQLSEFNISSNGFSGSIGDSFCSSTGIVFFDISNNEFSGPWPECLTDSVRLQDVLLNNNLFTGPVPASVGKLRSVIIFQLFENFFSGALPPAMTNMTRLSQLLLQSNQFTGSADPAFSGNFSSLVTVDLSENAFSQNIPAMALNGSTMLTDLAAITIINSCFTGSIPDSLCALPSLQSVIFGGLSAAGACQKKLLYTHTAGHLLSGTIPSCLFHMTSLTKLHLSGNGIKSLLPDIGANSSLVDIDFSHNRVHGTMPTSLQGFGQLTNLNLGYNYISGTVNGMSSLVLEAPSDNSTNATACSLTLGVNRLSGILPPNFADATSISVLDGNLFDCSVTRSTLPKNDVDANSYFCGSFGLTLAFSMSGYAQILLLMFCALISTVKFRSSCAQLCQGLGNGVQFLSKLIKGIMSTSIFEISVPAVYGEHVGVGAGASIGLLNTQVLFSTLCYFCKSMLMASVAIVAIIMPLFVLMKKVDGEIYSTHTYQYGWVVSGAYMTGRVPALTIIVVAIVCIGLVVYFQYDFNRFVLQFRDMEVRESHSSGRATRVTGASSLWTDRSDSHRGAGRVLRARQTCVTKEQAAQEFPNTPVDPVDEGLLYTETVRFRINVVVRCLQFMFNFVTVLCINILYVTLENSRNLLMRNVSIFAIAWFKICWNSVVVPQLVLGAFLVPERYRKTNKDFLIGCVLQYLCVICNVLLIPCFAIAVANSDCFSQVFAADPVLEVPLEYPVCVFDVAVIRNVSELVPYNVQEYIVDDHTADHDNCLYSTMVHYTESFQAPFLYSFQCMSALIVSYSPAFIVQYLFMGIVVPTVELLFWYLIRHRNVGDDIMNTDVAVPSRNWLGLCDMDMLRLKTLGLVGYWFWPVSEIIKQKMSVVGPDGKLALNPDAHLGKFSNCRNRVFNIIAAVSVLFSFGVLYPPLACVIAVAIVILIAQTLFMVQSHIDECAGPDVLRQSHPTRALQRALLSEWLERDCFMLHTVYTQSFYFLLVCASFFYGLYFYDVSSGNIVFGVLLFCLTLLLWFLSYLYWIEEQFDRPIMVWFSSLRQSASERMSFTWPQKANASMSSAAGTRSVISNPLIGASDGRRSTVTSKAGGARSEGEYDLPFHEI